MDTRAIRLLERIGQDGLRLAIRDTLDRSGLVGLANACRLKYPGRRAQAVEDDRLLDDLVKGFLKDDRVRAAVMKALIRANEDLVARLDATAPAELSSEISRLPGTGTAMGRALFAVGQDNRETTRAEIQKIREQMGLGAATSGSAAAQPEATVAKVTGVTGASAPGIAATGGGARQRRLEEEVAVLRERLLKAEDVRAHQIADLEGVREREAAAQKEVLAAYKEAHHLRKELGHLEAEVARLRQENLLLAGRVEEHEKAGSATGHLEEVSVRLNQFLREQKKMAHDIEALSQAKPAGGDLSKPYLDALAVSIESLRRQTADLRSDREEDSRKLMKALYDVASDLHAVRADLAQWRKAASEPAARRRSDQERVGLFVDVQNMYYAARQLNARLDFGALIAAVTRDRRLIRAIAYVVQNRDIDQSGFLAMLQQKNYEVRRKDLRIRHDGSSKGDWDMEMALDILRMADNLDVVALASGDGDFTSLVHQIKTVGPTVEVYSFPGSTAKELVEAADRHIPIHDGFLIRMPSSA